MERASLFCPRMLNTVAAMCDGVNPAMASWSAGDPWSMYLSGSTSGRHCSTQKFEPNVNQQMCVSILFATEREGTVIVVSL
jgi:hypothetical protein